MCRISKYSVPLLLLAGLMACSEPKTDVTPATIVVGPSGTSTLTSGTSVTLTAVVSNAGGSALSGQTVNWMSDDATIATVTSAGVVTGLHAGQTQITAIIGSVRSTPLSLTVTAGAPTQLGIRTQPAGGASGSPLTAQPVVEVRDAAGNLVTSATVTVTATIAQGGGALTGSTAQAVGGVATFTTLAISGSVGDRTLSFSVAGLAPVTSSGFAVNSGPGSQLVIRTQPTSATSGSPLGTPPVLEIRDDAGNLVTSANVPITAAIASGGGTVTGATATAVGGVATFSALTVSGAVGTRTLVFSSPGLPAALSASFTLVPGSATLLRIRTQPGGAASGGALTTQPIIEVTDGAGNLITSSTVVVTATVASGTATLTGGSATAVAGVATFSGLAVAGQGGQCALTFTAIGLTPITSELFSLAPGAPVRMIFLTQPAGARSGAPLTTQPVIEFLDQAGNVSTNYGGSVTASLVSGQGALSFASSTVTNGIAVFQSLTVTGPVGTVTLAFTSGSIDAIVSAPLAVSGPPLGPATHLVFLTVPPASAPNGVAMSPQPVIAVEDAAGNIVPSNVTITMTTDATSGSITNATAVAVNGVATFSGLTLSGPLGARNYIFSAPGLVSASLVRITITP